MSERERDVRYFLTPAFLCEVEAHTYGLFRDCVREHVDTRTGRKVREKMGKSLGPLKGEVFRRCEGDEKPDLNAVHGKTAEVIPLKRLV